MTSARMLSLDQAASSLGWGRLCGSADLFCTPDWFAVELDGSGPWVPAAHGCLVADGDARVDAGLVVQLFDRSVTDETCRVDKMLHQHEPFASGPAPDLAAALMPSLMCGGWFNSRVLTREGLTADAALAARRALVDEAEEVGRRWGAASVFFPYVGADEPALGELLDRAGYARGPAPARHVLSCDYPSYEDYLDQLPSRRRVRIRKELRKFAEAGVVTGAQTLDGGNVARIAELADNLERKYGQQIDPEQTVRWFSAIAKAVPTTVFTAERDGQVFAMTMWLLHRGRMYGFHAGFDYEIGGDLPMYSVLAFHLPTAFGCADPNLTVLEYGISADQAKLLRGTTAMPQFVHVKPLTERVPWVTEALAAR